MRFWVLLAVLVGCCQCHDDQKYDKAEAIPLYVDTVNPLFNPQESYNYWSLKWCKTKPLRHKQQTLSEVLTGNEKTYGEYQLKFMENKQRREKLCDQSLNSDEIAKFRRAIIEGYIFTWFFDEIPIKGTLGEIHKGDVYLYTHHVFLLSYNRDRVIDAKVATPPNTMVKLPMEGPINVTFTYSTYWNETDVAFEDRPANNLQLFEEEIEVQWFSVVNSFVLCILISTCMVFIVMRLLKKDQARYLLLDEEEDLPETGWKLIHSDVFRPPPYPCVFAAMVGTGLQLLLLFIIILTLSVIGVIGHYGRGTMYSTIIVVYSLSAGAAGFVAASLYKGLQGENWPGLVLTTSTIFAIPVFLIWSVLNTIAWSWGTTVALPFGTIMALFALYLLVGLPLTLCGTIGGRYYTEPWKTPKQPSKSSQPRKIPEVQAYRTPFAQAGLAGFLPFTIIYVELFYVCASLWFPEGHELTTPYSILYVLFIILLLVTASCTTMLIYLQLNNEDYRWWWASVVYGGVVAVFMYGYCFYFLATESHMYGFMQLSHYFGYMLLVSYGVFLTLGSVGFFSSFFFVKAIYGSTHAD
eukprot:TRINITY_DN57778_c0_g1_i1.p1 TRINITY_DN57778_c0_g1~~TRINITY_DN57778_c0_g1_i1.p1  ORF type:complete len:579 (+),score=59.36 TRINITY_DN57778_c0_g1_i1:37-1773(+)